MITTALQAVRQDRRTRLSRRNLVIGFLAVLVMALLALTLMLGQSFTPPGTVIRVLLGQDVPGRRSP